MRHRQNIFNITKFLTCIFPCLKWNDAVSFHCQNPNHDVKHTFTRYERWCMSCNSTLDLHLKVSWRPWSNPSHDGMQKLIFLKFFWRKKEPMKGLQVGIWYQEITLVNYLYSNIYSIDAFEDLTTASSLQIQLNSIRMRHGEDVNEYCHKVEKL